MTFKGETYKTGSLKLLKNLQIIRRLYDSY